MSTDELVRLSASEAGELAALEAEISEGLAVVQAAYIRLGSALTRIRDQRLYRQTHATFEDYCLDRWTTKRSRAYQYIEAAEVASKLLDKGMDPPTYEATARELAKTAAEIPPDELWARTRQETGLANPPARAVRETVQRHYHPPRPLPPAVLELKEQTPYPPLDQVARVDPESTRLDKRSATMLRLPPTELERLNEIIRRRGVASFQDYVIMAINADVRKHFPQESPFLLTAELVDLANQVADELRSQRSVAAERFRKTADAVLSEGPRKSAAKMPQGVRKRAKRAR